MTKNWKTTLLGILGGALILATSKGWIDKEISAFVGSSLVAIFGLVSKDFNVSGRTEIGLPKPRS
jgi:hypothetical protein